MWEMVLKWQATQLWYWMTDSAWSLFRSPKTEFLESVKMYSGDGFEMSDHSVVKLGKRLHGHYEGHPEQSSSKSVKLYLEMVLKWQATWWWYWGKGLYVHCEGLLEMSRVSSHTWRLVWNGKQSISFTEERLLGHFEGQQLQRSLNQ